MTFSVPRVKGADEVESGVEFFRNNPLLAFENESDTFKRPEDIGYHRESLLLHEGSRRYDGRHPAPAPMTEPISKLFPMLRPRDIRLVEPLRTPIEADDSFFVRMKTKRNKTTWFLHTRDLNLIWPVGDRATLITEPNLVVERQHLYWGSGNRGKIVTRDDTDSIPVQQAVGFITAMIGGHKLKPFEALGMCKRLFGEMPPVDPESLRFYQRIVGNPEFLFAFVGLKRRKISDQKIYDAWIDTVGHHLKTLFPLIIRRYLATVSDKMMLFRGNTFETFLVTSYIYRDAGFMGFVERFSPPRADPVGYFLKEFESVRLSPLTKWILQVIIMETKRVFDEIDAPYYSISAILFLRVLAAMVLERHVDSTGAMKQIANVFSLSPAGEKSDIEKYKQLIDKYSSFQSTKLRLRPALMTPLSIVNILMSDVFATGEQLVNVAEEMNLEKAINDYWRSLEEQNLQWP